MEFVNIELIAGTYEQFVLGYKVTFENQEIALQQTYAIHSHNASVRCVAAAGMYAASGGADEVIQLYDMTRRKCSGALTQHEGTVTCLEFTPSGSHLMSGSEDGSIAVCRTGSWQLEKLWKQAHKGAVAVYGFLNIAPISLGFHPSGKLALSLGTDGILKTWNMVKGRLAYAKNLGSANRRLVTCVLWSLKGDRYVVVVGTKAHVYSVATAEITYTVDGDKKISSVCFVENKVLCVGDDGGAVHLHSVIGKEQLNEVEAHSNRVKCMASGSMDGCTYLVSAASSGQIKLWEYKKRALSYVCSVETGCRITCLVVCRPSAAKKTVKKAVEKMASTSSLNLSDESIVAVDKDNSIKAADTFGSTATDARPKRKSGEVGADKKKKRKKLKGQQGSVDEGVVLCTPGQAWTVENV